MQETFDNKQASNFEDEIDLRELFMAVFDGKWIIILITTILSIIGVLYSLSLPNVYHSNALLVSVKPTSGISSAMRNYGSLAGLAGINIPTIGDDSNSSKAITKLGSLSFFQNSILPNIFLPDLMAVKSWDIKTNTLVYDKTAYDIESNTWVRDYSYPNQQIPSAQESFRVFKSEHFNISEDVKTGFITLTVKHQSPHIAKIWTELLVNEINSFYRHQDKLESQKALIYLNEQISLTNLSEIKQVIAELLQQETQKLTLIEAKQFYVFDYIDPPAAMEKKSEPKRALICIYFAFFGGILGLLFVLIRHYGFRKSVS